MAERTGGLVGQSQAVTFDGLVRLILGRSPRYATDLERALIAARLLHGLDLEALGSHAHLPGSVPGWWGCSISCGRAAWSPIVSTISFLAGRSSNRKMPLLQATSAG